MRMYSGSFNCMFSVLILSIFSKVIPVDSDLRSDLFKELNCPKGFVNLYDGKVDFLWLLSPSRFYMPMASERIYRASAEVLLGRPAKDEAELDQIDLKLFGFLTALRISGFSTRSFQKLCFPINRPLRTFPKNLLEATCLGLLGSPGVDLSLVAHGVDSIAWTDNQNAVLFTPCAGDVLDWFVLSKQQTLPEDVKDIILTKITSLGFNPKNAISYDYHRKRFVRGPKTETLASSITRNNTSHSNTTTLAN